MEGLEQTDDVKTRIKELKRQWEKEIKDLAANIDKLLSEEVPTGAGLAFRVSKILSGVRNDISSKNKDIIDAMSLATDEQKQELERLTEVWEDAYREEGNQKLDQVAQSYFNEMLKKQKLDIDMGGISTATIQQLNRLKAALKDISNELSGSGLVDLFESAGLSIEEFKGHLDMSNLSSIKESLINLTTYTPEDIQLTEDQKKALEAIARVIGVIDSNQKKGLFDIDLSKFSKAKSIADEVFFFIFSNRLSFRRSC